jgi:tungstate transport system substrate-binding protein
MSNKGDDGAPSRTDILITQIYRQARIEPQGDRYFWAGGGMGQVLHMAGERRAYALNDRATFLARREAIELAILLQGDPSLLNRYSDRVVNPERRVIEKGGKEW